LSKIEVVGKRLDLIVIKPLLSVGLTSKELYPDINVQRDVRIPTILTSANPSVSDSTESEKIAPLLSPFVRPCSVNAPHIIAQQIVWQSKSNDGLLNWPVKEMCHTRSDDDRVKLS
jgi:hypothetical protein